tara:strand:- start:149373 stop:149705 length:333 start_codon:yes stop_codon:yes gene_type:complete
MNCNDLATRLSSLQPQLSQSDVARLCLLILNQTDDPSELEDDANLVRIWRNASFRLDSATDQHAAVIEELDQICSDGPVQFTPDQIWMLLRAVKVQSQILDLYNDTKSLV